MLRKVAGSVPGAVMVMLDKRGLAEFFGHDAHKLADIFMEALRASGFIASR